MSTYYKSGQVTVTNGSATVTSDGNTAFISQIAEGDMLVLGGVVAIVASVDASDSLTLSDPWPGPTTTTSAYAINRTGSSWHSTVTFNQRMTDLLDTLTQQVANAGGSTATTLAALSLSNSSVSENSAAGVVVGSVQGKSTGSTLALVDDAGGRFVLNGLNQIVTGSTATDYESATYHQVTVRETLSGASNTPRDTTFTILVLDVYEGATVTLAALSLSPSVVTSGAAAGTVVGSLSGQTSGSTVTLTDNAGGRFSINGSNGNYQIVCGSTATNYSSATSHQITVRESFTGATNTPRDTVITITVQQASSAPTLGTLTLSSATITSGAAQGTTVGTISGKNASSTLTMTDTAGGRFALSGNTIVAGATATNYATSTTHKVTVRETLSGATNSPRDTTFTITVQNNPSSIQLAALSLSSKTIMENSAQGTVIGAIQGITAGSSLALQEDAGGRVAISGTNLVCGPVNIDYEILSSFTVIIRETLGTASNSPRDNTFTITVQNDTSESSNILYGFPDANSTGPRSATTQTLGATGSTSDGQVFSRITFTDRLTINHENVIVRDCIFDLSSIGGGDAGIMIPDPGPKNTLVEYCEFRSMTNGIAGMGTFQYNDFHTIDNGVNVYGPSQIQHNYIHDMGFDLNNGHFDGIEINGGGGTTIYHNTIINEHTQTSAVQLNNYFGGGTHIVVDSNYLAGGGYTIYLDNRFTPDDPITDVQVKNNYLGQGYYGYYATWDNNMALSNNVELGTNWPTPSSASGPGGGGSVTLATLTLSNASVQEHSAEGTVVGNVQGTTAGSTLTLSDDAGGHFKLVGSQIQCGATATDYATANALTIQLTETLSGASNSPKVTSIQINITQAAAGGSTTDSYFYPSAVPTGTSTSEKEVGITLGLALHINTTGYLSGVAWYRNSASQDTTITVGIWKTSDGSNLLVASKNVTVSGTGWKYAALDTPLAVTAGEEYRIGYFQNPDANGNVYYQATVDYWAAGVQSPAGSMTVIGSYYNAAASMAMPDATYRATNYWVDAVFSTSGSGAATLSNLGLTNSSIQEGSAQGTTVGAITGKTTGSTLSLTDTAGGRFALSGTNIVCGATATDYATATSHSITIRETLTGATNTPHDTTLTITVTQAAAGGTGDSVYYPDTTPTNAQVGSEPSTGLNLGAKVQVINAGQILGVAWYRPSTAQNAAVTVGLWQDDAGVFTLLASKAGTASGTGWQYIAFDTPVDVTAGQDYQAGVFIQPSGGNVVYEDTPAYFGAGDTSPGGNVHIGGSRYAYAASAVVPDTDSTDNYWVDVVFN